MHGRLMTKLAIAALFTALAVTSVDARGFSRSGSVTGPRGNTITSQGSGSCAGGSCSSQQTITGPRGGVTTRSNSAQCANGQCTTSHTTTGPRGQSINRQSTITPN